MRAAVATSAVAVKEVRRAGVEPAMSRTREPGLQPGAFGHSATCAQGYPVAPARRPGYPNMLWLTKDMLWMSLIVCSCPVKHEVADGAGVEPARLLRPPRFQPGPGACCREVHPEGGRGGSRTLKAVTLAGFRSRYRRQSACPSTGGWGASRTLTTLAGPPGFKPEAGAYRLAHP